MRVIKHWKRLLGGAVESPSLVISQSRLSVALGTVLWLPLPRARGWLDSAMSGGRFSVNCSVTAKSVLLNLLQSEVLKV